MDKYQALYRFWASFKVADTDETYIPAYEENSVPDADKDNSQFPYITYQAASSVFNGAFSASASVWTRSTSWAQADTIANRIETALKDGGIVLHYDDGTIWISIDSTFAQNMGDPDDNMIKRKLLTVTYNFF